MTKKTPNDIKPEKYYERWSKVLAVLFRVLIIAGLLLLILVALGFLFNRLNNYFIFLLPAFLILIGIFLAWLEYLVHQRLMAFKNHENF